MGIIQSAYEPFMRQEIKTVSDRNGNSRRCHVIMSGTGNILDVLTDSYGNLSKWVKELVELPSVNVAPREYRSFLSFQARKD